MNIYAKGRTYSAMAELTKEMSVVVYKGSQICPISSDSLPTKTKKLRVNPEFISAENILIKNMSFNSVSTAATFVTGTVSNGYKVWKYKNTKDFVRKTK